MSRPKRPSPHQDYDFFACINVTQALKNNIPEKALILASLINLWQYNDTNQSGWCYATRETLMRWCGYKKTKFFEDLEGMKSFGLIREHPDTKYLQTTEKYEREFKPKAAFFNDRKGDFQYQNNGSESEPESHKPAKQVKNNGSDSELKPSYGSCGERVMVRIPNTDTVHVDLNTEQHHVQTQHAESVVASFGGGGALLDEKDTHRPQIGFNYTNKQNMTEAPTFHNQPEPVHPYREYIAKTSIGGKMEIPYSRAAEKLLTDETALGTTKQFTGGIESHAYWIEQWGVEARVRQPEGTMQRYNEYFLYWMRSKSKGKPLAPPRALTNEVIEGWYPDQKSFYRAIETAVAQNATVTVVRHRCDNERQETATLQHLSEFLKSKNFNCPIVTR